MTELTGSCLCGAVQYRVEGDVRRFYHCHCQRCRKASGTGHASNLLIKAEGIEWLSGADLVGSYKVPEAERFRNDFCTRCGSSLPRYFAERGAVTLPAGTLDCDAPTAPEARIFADSAVSWSCLGDDLPAFSQYPE